ncbi:MAG TPA: site-specific integrase [Humisphaera sp.]|jgi:integrase|nr:site-specific integrase [Humisphaera sp.]
MASISDDKNGRRRLMFFDTAGNRQTIYLGKIPKDDAQVFRMHVEQVVSAAIRGSAPPDKTSRWLADLPDKMRNKLAKYGVGTARQSSELGAFLDQYIAARVDVKSGTALVLGHARRNLIDHFGKGKQLRAITPGDADAWRLALIAEGLASNTIRRRTGVARQFFRAAQRAKLVDDNPFADLPATVQGSTARDHFVSRDDAQKVLDACPDDQWRLLFALSRFGGLRCPSEHLALKWTDVDWRGGKLRVPSPKTEHIKGLEQRIIPLFPELRAPLAKVLEQSRGGLDEPIITRYRDTNCNLRTQLFKIIRRAGLTPWPKLFQNLRSTREIELCNEHPEHVVAQWIGHTSAVARKHYLRATEDHFQKAAQNTTQKVGETREIETNGVAATQLKQADSHDIQHIPQSQPAH